MYKQKLEAAKKLFFILLGIDMLVTAIVLISYIWVVGILKDVDSGVIVADASLISTVGFWDNFAKIMFLTLIGVGVGLVKWLNACYTYAKETLRTSGFKQDSWTAFGWILPIMNLFKPYQVINEIYKVGGLGYQNTEDWKKESWSGLLLTWWIFYAITHLIGTIATKYLLKQAIRVDATMQQSISSIELSSIFCVFSIIIAALWFLVVSSLTRRLLERNAVVHAVQTPTTANSGAVIIPTETPLQSAQPSRISINPGLPIQPIQANFAASTTSTSVTSDDLWAQALAEYDSGSRKQGLWARLFSEVQGNESVVKANYLRIRVDEMQRIVVLEKERLESAKQAEIAMNRALVEEKNRQMQAYDALPKGLCPNCKAAILPLSSESCSKCGALFGSQSLFKITELSKVEQDALLSKWMIDGAKLTSNDVTLLVLASMRDAKILTRVSTYHRETLLHIAAKLNDLNAIRILLENGANPDALDWSSKKPYQMTNNDQIKQLLQVVEK